MEQGNKITNGIRINYWKGGSGKPIVLLHGAPQTAYMWRKITPTLLKKYTVICPDIRGYGDTQKPESGYDKKNMALDIKLLMQDLGYEEFIVVSHDRGARVAHRLALDFPESVEKLCLLDIVPTHTLLSNTDKELAVSYWHWYFFQLQDIPEKLLLDDPEYAFNLIMHNLTFNMEGIDEKAKQEYLRAFKIPGTIRAILSDYRAAATTDFKDDERDLDKKIKCPTLVLWGKRGKMHQKFNVLNTWKKKAENVKGRALNCGHFVAEESPEELINELKAFL